MITPYRDDGSILSMILPAAVWQLHLKGETEVLALRTVRSDFTHIKGESVHVEISPISVPTVRYAIQPAFTVKWIDLIDQTYQIQSLKRRLPFLRDIPLQPFKKFQPLVLLGSDNSHLISPIDPVRRSSQGGLIPVHTQLGWTLQGHEGLPEHCHQAHQCFFLAESQ